MSKPLFVIGNPRSGTSVLRLMLTAHPSFVVPPEAGFMCWLLPEYSRTSSDEWESEATQVRFAAQVASSKKFETWNLSADEIVKALALRKPHNYSEACECVYLTFLKTFKPFATRWGDKNNFHCQKVETLRTLFPQAQILHIVRDPRDVACSYRGVMQLETNNPYLPQLPVDCREIAQQWVQNIQAIQSAARTISPEDYKIIRYEALTACPEDELSRLCDWLGVNFDPVMLRFHELNKRDHLEPKQTLDWKMRTLEPISPESVGRYLQELSSEEINAIEQVSRKTMLECGYSPGSRSSGRVQITTKNGTLEKSQMDGPTLNSGHFTEAELRALGIKCGENVLVHRTVQFFGNNISIGSNVRIDCFCTISSNEEVSIGNYVHLGPYVCLMGRAGLAIEDFAGLSARVSVFTATDDYSHGYLTNPMVPDTMRQVKEAPVFIRRHAVIGAGTVVLPGVEIGRGASIGALSLVHKSVPPYTIATGTPLREIGQRDKGLLERLEREVLEGPPAQT